MFNDGCAWWACVCGFDHTAHCSVPAGFSTHVYALPMCEEYRHYLKQLSVVGVMPSCHVDQSQKVLMCNCVSKLDHWPFHSPQGYADLPHLVCRIRKTSKQCLRRMTFTSLVSTLLDVTFKGAWLQLCGHHHEVHESCFCCMCWGYLWLLAANWYRLQLNIIN